MLSPNLEASAPTSAQIALITTVLIVLCAHHKQLAMPSLPYQSCTKEERKVLWG